MTVRNHSLSLSQDLSFPSKLFNFSQPTDPTVLGVVPVQGVAKNLANPPVPTTHLLVAKFHITPTLALFY